MKDDMPRKFVYFKDRAKELGCTNVSTLSDLQVWQYILKHQDQEITE